MVVRPGVLTSTSVVVIYDDRGLATTGEKLADADLMGIPFRLVISDKTVTDKVYELKARTQSEPQMVQTSELIQVLENQAY